MYNIFGIRRVTSKKDGIRYVELHLSSKDRFVEGQRFDVVFVREDMIENFSSFNLGCFCDVYYNRLGRVERVVIHDL